MDPTDPQAACFEAGVKFGSLYHQFAGTPVAPGSTDSLETAMTEAIENQPYCERVTVEIHEDRVRDALVDRLRAHVHQFYGASADAQQASEDYARLVHEDHYEAVTALLSDAVDAGATVALGGQHDADTNFVAPTVLTDVPLDADIMQDEIFGPLLPVLSYGSLDDALQIINNRPSPLSQYVFSERETTVDSILSRTTAGSTCVNEAFLHFINPNLPFGGKGESGIGRGHGRRSFQEFSNERSVLRRSYGSELLRPLYPPYNRLTSRVADWVLRFF